MADSLLVHLEKLLERICISGTTWRVHSCRSFSSSAVTLSMLSLLQTSPNASQVCKQAICAELYVLYKCVQSFCHM